jgi:N-methylhydantoinase B
VNCVLQNAGGYGDPLLRDPNLVCRDVREGKVSRKYASSIYGVEVTSDGGFDSVSVEHARREIAKHRLSQATNGPNVAAKKVAADEGCVQMRWGTALSLHCGPNGPQVVCGNCEMIMGDLGTDWRDSAASRIPAPGELGPSRVLDHRFRYEQTVCPHCAASLWIDVRKIDEHRAVDFKLNWPAPG